MIYEVMRHIRNFFQTEKYYSGEFEIVNGTIGLPIPNGQYIWVEGSISNNGVYKYPPENLTDETFNGIIWILAPPKDFITLVADIEKFTTDMGSSPYVSESFGGYSYTKAQGKNGGLTWTEAFSKRLNTWRKI